jgi:hypothetical protein
MSMTMEASSNGRSIRFTPERLEQIRNLVERGLSREQIAETIGTTLGSLQVTCSKMGISLRKRSFNGRPPKAPSKTPAPTERTPTERTELHVEKQGMAMTEITLEFISKQIARIYDELRVLRQEQRRLSENQMLTIRAINSLRHDLELTILTEIGGLFVHLETRLEQCIEESMK